MFDDAPGSTSNTNKPPLISGCNLYLFIPPKSYFSSLATLPSAPSYHLFVLLKLSGEFLRGFEHFPALAKRRLIVV